MARAISHAGKKSTFRVINQCANMKAGTSRMNNPYAHACVSTWLPVSHASDGATAPVNDHKFVKSWSRFPSPSTSWAEPRRRSPFTAPAPIVGYAPADATPGCIPDRKPGTAIVVLRRVSADTTPVAQASGAPFLQVSKCNTDPKAWMFSDNPANFTLHNLDCAT